MAVISSTDLLKTVYIVTDLHITLCNDTCTYLLVKLTRSTYL